MEKHYEGWFIERIGVHVACDANDDYCEIFIDCYSKATSLYSYFQNYLGWFFWDVEGSFDDWD